VDFVNLKERQEHKLIMKLAKYPEIIARAGENYSPAEIAKYLFELAQEFNEYYHKISVLKAEEEIKKARLVLIGAIGEVIKNGLSLLGIETVDEM
jgi:arginyl-tRNA synthetase